VASQRFPESLDQILAEVNQVCSRQQLVEAVFLVVPPLSDGPDDRAFCRDNPRIGLDQTSKVTLVRDDIGKLHVGVVPGREEMVWNEAMGREQVCLGCDLALGDSAVQVR
jgi:hypothetical protein